MVNLTSNLALFRLVRLTCTDFNGIYKLVWLLLFNFK